MKIKTAEKSLSEVLAIKPAKHPKPCRQSGLLRKLMKIASGFELRKAGFNCTYEGMKDIAPTQPIIVLMNHSSFIDLEMVATMFAHRPYHIVCTRDGFVGKEGLMRKAGCIPTEKFISDVHLVRDMKYCLHDLGESVVMYPEASYSFDGTATPLPPSVGKCLKMMGVPVVMVRTSGAFLYDPLYNCLQKRKVKVSAHVGWLFSAQQLEDISVEDINQALTSSFTFDHFKEQYEQGLVVSEPFRADGLHRALYKCPHCGAEGHMEGKGTKLTCHACGKVYQLTERGKLEALEGPTEYQFVSDWYAWERACVRQELQAGTYRLEDPVDICVLVDTECVYRVGEGVLTHSDQGFHLTGCHGQLDYSQKPEASYSLYADYYWYELGDMVAIGTAKCRYYCFPKDQEHAVVAKVRLAAEELYKLRQA